MSEFEFHIKETEDTNDEGMPFTMLCDPFGTNLFRSQYSYMASDKATDLNRYTKSLREKFQEQAKRIAELEAENARMKELLKRIYALPQIKDIAISILIEDALGLNDPKPTPAQGSPQPSADKRYVYGDKVRVVFEEYEAGKYDTIIRVHNGKYALKDFDGWLIQQHYEASELEPYTESEALPSAAEIAELAEKQNRTCPNCGKRFNDIAFVKSVKSAHFAGNFCNAACVSEYEKERGIE